MILCPLAAFLVAVSSVRTRRASANLAVLGLASMLLVTLVVAWGMARHSAPFSATYSYINASVTFLGPTNFQQFVMGIVLRVDHVTVAALLAIEVTVLGAVGWHRVMGREPGPARFYAEVSVLAFAAAGVLVSWDLAEMLAFWGIAGGATYLLQTHRWGSDETAERSRIALALPFLTDLFLLCGVGWLYARYGVQSIDTLLPALHTTAGWTVRALVVGSVLLFVGVAGRMALWPLQQWITRTVLVAPPAASAIVQGVWPVLGVVTLYRLAPIFAASNVQTVRALMYACAISAAIAPIAALLGNEPRRVMALLGSGATAAAAAVVIHGFEDPRLTFAVVGVACALAVAPARAAATLLASVIAGAMRTDDLAEMGEAWRRLRRTSTSLLLSTVVLGLSTAGALVYGVGTRSWLGAALGESLLLTSAGALRLFLVPSFGQLPRRRAFEPDRVREDSFPAGASGWPLLLGIGAAALLAASFIGGWLRFLDGLTHPAPASSALAAWIGVAVLGFAAATLAFVSNKAGAVRASSLSGAWLASGGAAAKSWTNRFLVAPATDIGRRVDAWIRKGDGALGRLATETGRLAVGSARPYGAILLLVAVGLAAFIALLVPGLAR